MPAGLLRHSKALEVVAPLTLCHLYQGDVPHDDGQYVVEVMGDPPGQHPDRFQLLVGMEMLLHLFPLGDVPDDPPHGIRHPAFIPDDKRP